MKKLLFSLLFFPSLAFAGDVSFTELRMFPDNFTSPGSFENFVIDQTTDAVTGVFQCSKACAIDALCFRQGSATGTPVAHQVSLQGVSATTGAADGTIKSATNAKSAFTPVAGGDNTIQCKTLTSSYTCTLGEMLAEVISPTGTPDVSNKESFTYGNDNSLDPMLPYGLTRDAGVETKRSRQPFMAYKCGATVVGAPFQDWSNETFGSDGTPDERGNVFVIPSTMCSTAVVGGVRLKMRATSGESFKVILYEGTTARQTITIDADTIGASGTNRMVDAYFDGSFTATCGSAYRVALQPQNTGGTSVGLEYLDVAATGDLAALAPFGTTAYKTGRTDAGAWTDTNTRVYHMSLLVKDMTLPASGGLRNQNQISGGAQ